MLKNRDERNCRNWPEGCLWPEPGMSIWDYDVGDEFDLKEQDFRACPELEELIDAKSMYDNYDVDEDDLDYWDMVPDNEFWSDGTFDYDAWVDCFCECMSGIKLYGCTVAYDIEEAIGYDFGNENLLRQAFTRRAFAIEHGLGGCSEELEFIGDRVLDYVIVRLMTEHYGELDELNASVPFAVRFDEGKMSKIKAHYVCKEYLSQRAEKLGLDKYILYGTADKESESSREDMIEALIGAVAVDSGWNYDVLEEVVDRLLEPHLETPGALLEEDYFDVFNSWHQKKFGCMPYYEVYRSRDRYACTLRFMSDRVDMEADTRSKARSLAAEIAVRKLQQSGMWMNVADSGIVPNLENSINQLQELYQKKYVDKPVYSFEDMDVEWRCDCLCSGICESGKGESKTAAKKQAAYEVIKELLQ